MKLKNSTKIVLIFLFTYLINFGLALYFSKGVKTIYPSSLLVIVSALGGLFIGIILASFTKSEERRFSSFIYLIFQSLQAVIGFSVAHYLFHLSLKDSFIFPTGALIALIIGWIIFSELSHSLMVIFLTLCVPLGLAIALRLKGVWGGLCCGIILLNSFSFGLRNWSRSEENLQLFFKALCFGSILAIGRAVIQYYLIESSYDSLGVVITHPYTFIALFIGISTPLILWKLEKEKSLNPYLQLILVGVCLPLLLGIFLHTRPFAGYLLGLVVSSFVVGLLLIENYLFQFILFFNFIVALFSVSFFQKLSYFSRIDRIVLLAAVFVVFILSYLFIRRFQKKNEMLQTT